MYKGKRTRKLHEKLTHNEQGERRFPFPSPCSGQFLNIMDGYKHVGIYAAANGRHDEDAVHLDKTAMNVYVHLASRALACPIIDTHLRLSFAESLVFSRLLHETQLWLVTHHLPHALRPLNNSYMRVLRRTLADADTLIRTICLTSRYVNFWSNLTLIANCKSDGYLTYDALRSHGSDTLLSVLHSRIGLNRSQMLPWLKQLLQDLRGLQMFHASRLAALGDPVHSPLG